ncbi:hypothetical protein [Allokutzneria oryzae]|uniref:Uncharacterized protein n=1 Tax=Allokutzneria oryzae TaxID=1378989 RepID=A0ABV6AB85_9PSEU
MTRHPHAAVDAAMERRTSPSDWLVALGASHVLLGGLVAAVTGPLELRHGSWLAAYLVLVCGVAQYAMGRAPSWFDRHPCGGNVWIQVAGWNSGNVAVVVGTLAAARYLVDVGGAVLLVVLVGALRSALQRPVRTPAVGDRSLGPLPTARLPACRARVAYVASLVVLVDRVRATTTTSTVKTR